MSTETRMAIEHSIPAPQRSESGVSVRYETKVFSLWERKASAEVAHACVYEIAWIPERQWWRRNRHGLWKCSSFGKSK